MILKPRISGDISYKRKWEYFAAIIGLVLGYPLLLLTFLIPNYSSSFIYAGLDSFAPSILAGINPMLEPIPALIKGIMISISDISIANPYYPLTIFFISFVEFPSCLAWLVPGILIGYHRNKQFYNIDVKNTGWKVFWHGMIFIELVIIIMALGLILMFLMQFIPGLIANEAIISYFGSGILKMMMFAGSPFFWLGLLSAGLGGYIGKRIAINKVSPAEVVIEEVEPEEVFEAEEMEISEAIMDESMIWPEAAGAKEDEGRAEIDVSGIKEKIKTASDAAAATTAATQDMIKCNKCGKALPALAKFCNNCGNKLWS